MATDVQNPAVGNSPGNGQVAGERRSPCHLELNMKISSEELEYLQSILPTPQRAAEVIKALLWRSASEPTPSGEYGLPPKVLVDCEAVHCDTPEHGPHLRWCIHAHPMILPVKEGSGPDIFRDPNRETGILSHCPTCGIPAGFNRDTSEKWKKLEALRHQLEMLYKKSEENQALPNPVAVCSSVFEVVDVTSEEVYWTLGVWLTLETAMATLDVSDPEEISCNDADEYDGYRMIEVRERKIGWGGVGKRIARIEWKRDYVEVADQYVWTRQTIPLSK